MKSGLEDRNNQYIEGTSGSWGDNVSMKSGLEDRNNGADVLRALGVLSCLNEVRPGRPEQFHQEGRHTTPGNSVSMKSGLEDRNNDSNWDQMMEWLQVSMKSGLEDRNNHGRRWHPLARERRVSMKSGLEDRNNKPQQVVPQRLELSQ